MDSFSVISLPLPFSLSRCTTTHIIIPSSIVTDWAGLPKHLLDQIFGKFELLKDCLVFSSVCRSWQCIAKDNQGKIADLMRHQVPILLVPSESKDDNVEFSMYNVLDYKSLSTKLVLPPIDRAFGGSSEGWLVTLDENLGVTLYKPFTESDENTIIHLPPLFPPMEKRILELTAQYREEHIVKLATFTPKPLANPKDLTIVVVFGEFRYLAYISPAKDSSWTSITVDVASPSFDDVLYYKNKFYAITTRRGELVSFDVTDSSNLNMKLAAEGIPSDDEEEENDDKEEEEERYFCFKRYLAESMEGDLLHVKRYMECSADRVTRMFRVFKWSSDVPRWVEIKNLGDNALFVGDNISISVLASTFAGCQKNSIYFTHDKDTTGYTEDGPKDLGVYNLETRVCTLGFTFDAATISKMVGPKPIWVLPTFSIY